MIKIFIEVMIIIVAIVKHRQTNWNNANNKNYNNNNNKSNKNISNNNSNNNDGNNIYSKIVIEIKTRIK